MRTRIAWLCPVVCARARWRRCSSSAAVNTIGWLGLGPLMVLILPSRIYLTFWVPSISERFYDSLYLAFNTAQVYRLQAGERLATMAIGRLRRLRQRELGTAPAVIYLAGCYGVFSLEELLAVLGTAPRESLLPALRTTSSSDAPT